MTYSIIYLSFYVYKGDNMSLISAPRVLDIINMVFCTIVIICYLMQNIHMVVALFSRKRKFKEASKNHKFGYIICARNESNVVGQLIDSINNQDYPKDLMTVFVVADNCTDDHLTANIARSKGAVVFERFNKEEVGKSWALDYVFKTIKENHSYDDIEAFMLFDADNLVSPEYTKEMNKTFDNGYEVATSTRDCKNWSSSMTAACSGIMFLRECLVIHHSRSKLRLSTYVSGTGFYVSRNVLNKFEGWPFHKLIEDIEFSSWCSLNNINIGYNESAVFYDEQPNKLSTANKQRLRWAKGTSQCFRGYGFKLLKSVFKPHRTFQQRLSSWEMNIHICPLPLLTTLWTMLYVLLHVIFFLTNIESGNFFDKFGVKFILAEIFAIFGFAFIHALIALIKYHKHIRINWFKKIWACILFPFFAALYIPIYFIALFMKDVKWQPIAHTEAMTMENIAKEEEKLNRA